MKKRVPSPYQPWPSQHTRHHDWRSPKRLNLQSRKLISPEQPSPRRISLISTPPWPCVPVLINFAKTHYEIPGKIGWAFLAPSTPPTKTNISDSISIRAVSSMASIADPDIKVAAEKPTSDEEQLAALGHVQELRREFSLWSIVCLQISLMATWEALSSVVATALTNGGAPCLFYN